MPNARRFGAGHRIQLMITSDDQPRNIPVFLGYRHAPVGTTARNTIHATSRCCRSCLADEGRIRLGIRRHTPYHLFVAATQGTRILRLGPSDREVARRTFVLMAEVFGVEQSPLSDGYLDLLLARPEFWVFTAMSDGSVVGGLTAHTLMMTAFEGAEVFLYDIAVDPEHQRRGFGQRLVDALRREASSLGIHTVFVPADDEDTHALDFYRALGGAPTKVTFFEFSR